MTAALCLFVKNEVGDLAEWVAHHAGIGFDRLLIYDNCSDDGTSELVARLAEAFPIDHILWGDEQDPVRGLTKQGAAYTDCLARYRKSLDWIAFLDADEFLVPPTADALVGSLLRRHEMDAAVALNWLFFGSSWLEATDGRLVMDAFLRRARRQFGQNRHVKMFVRPDAVTRNINPHYFETVAPCVDLRREIMRWSEPGIAEIEHVVHGDWRLHHYFVRSRAHWRRRQARRQPNGIVRSAEDFEHYDRNEVLDASALPFARLAQASLARAGIVTPPVLIDAAAEMINEQKSPSPAVSALLCVVDAIQDGCLRGWAVDPGRPERKIVLRARFDATVYALVRCELSRRDVLRSSVGREHVGFNVPLPPEILCPGAHTMELLDDCNRTIRFVVGDARWLTYSFAL